MVDPITIGGLAVSALAMAGEAVLKGSLGEGAKDAYHALKNKIARWAGPEVKALEENPASQELQTLVAGIVDNRSPAERTVAREFAEQLIAALRNGGNVGLDVGRLDALEVQLGSITVFEGTGVRIGDARVAGTFKAKKVIVGKKPGKS